MNTLGIDHGTQSIRFSALSNNGEGVNFEIAREEVANKPILDEIKKRVPFPVDLVGVSYSMGDAINAIVDLKKVRNRGVLEERTGSYVGGGTKVFDEIFNSNLDAVLIPGLHRGIECLDPRIKALYSHCAASEKVGLSYHIFSEANKKTKTDNLIISDISSNTVTIGIKDGVFFGAIDACLGAIGRLHGPVDLETIRRIDSGEISANKAFYSSGAIKILEGDKNLIFDPEDENSKIAMDSLILSVSMEISGLINVIDPDMIYITGSLGINERIYYSLKDVLERFCKVEKINGFSAARGNAEIAMSVLNGEKDILGIPIEY